MFEFLHPPSDFFLSPSLSLSRRVVSLVRLIRLEFRALFFFSAKKKYIHLRLTLSKVNNSCVSYFFFDQFEIESVGKG